MMINCFDPYDLWSTNFGILIRKSYYRGNILGKIGAVLFSVFDLFSPQSLRWLFRIKPRAYPILSAHFYLMRMKNDPKSLNRKKALADLKMQATGLPESAAWGLGFPWMSKNGLYGPEVPFVTHTPYVMDTLLALSEDANCRNDAMALFHHTWEFLDSLEVMQEDSDTIALSYAPLNEPRIVINANAYAAYAYSLHAIYGRETVREIARDKALRLAKWVVSQQNENGSWFYYADRGPGNFIDGFHSCFVVKNLLKVKKLLPEIAPIVDDPVACGWAFIRQHLFDARAGLCRRFVQRSHRDPFKWDLYDQAEYLGLLVDFCLLDEAGLFSEQVEQRFRKGEHWYCRIDIFGRRWGRDFLRWGIAPFQYHQGRLLHIKQGNL